MISVIVIGKNEGERLVACLRSIQTALNVLAHEVVYVDSCSTDQSLQTAKALGARCFLLAERKTTAGLGRFVGAKEARGEYLLFLDGDMQLQPGFAEKALMAIAAKGYDGVCGIREDVYLRGGEVVGRNENYFGCTQERIAPEFGGALMITREALNACGGWATDTVACEEAELHARLNAMGCRIAEIPVPMILHTDAVRDSRSPLSTVFSARRLGLIQVDEPFGGCYAHTVSAFLARRCAVACVQLELNSRLLWPDFAEYDMAGVFAALCDCHRLLCRLTDGK